MATQTTRARIEALRAYLEKINAGRDMKAPGESISDIIYRTPAVHVGFYPNRPQPMARASRALDTDAASAPSILIMLAPSQAQNMEEERFDQRQNIGRPDELGGKLSITLLFAVYEPGTRLHGFDGHSPERIMDATDEGFYTLTDWMDDVVAALITARHIPGSDMYVWPGSVQYSSYADGDYIADRRPLYYGMVSVTFGYYARQIHSAAGADAIDKALEVD
jgi:hypothetical protein